MKLSRSILVVLSTVAVTGCAHPPRPYVFNTSKQSGDPFAILASSLSRQGHRISAVDRGNAEIVTYWEDTGYKFRETDDLEAQTTIFLRYRVQVGQSDNRVSVRAEAQRCVPSDAVITRERVESTCIRMDKIFGTQQQAVDRLGQSLAASLSGAG